MSLTSACLPSSRVPPIHITLLSYDYSLGAALMSMHDLLYFAGTNYANSQLENAKNPHNRDAVNRFDIRIASPEGAPLKLMNQLSLNTHYSYDGLQPSDIYLIPAMAGEPERTLAANTVLVDLLKRVDLTQSLLGANSNACFFLAEAGLLEHKRVTTFWGNAERFAQRYPSVRLESEERLVRDGNIITDSGGSSWLDLGLYLVEQFCDHRTAVATAKYFMVDLARSAQISFAPEFGEQQHKDKHILGIQDWLAKHYNEAIVLTEVADRFGLSSRSLIRRFKVATGLTPVNYLQELRLDAASRLLMQSRRSVEDITHAVGYQDVSSFIRLFKRRTGYSPSSYRNRFKSV